MVTSCNGGVATEYHQRAFSWSQRTAGLQSADVINTLIQPTYPPFQYSLQIPSNQPPGLYLYHPHPHGFTTVQSTAGRQERSS